MHLNSYLGNMPDILYKSLTAVMAPTKLLASVRTSARRSVRLTGRNKMLRTNFGRLYVNHTHIPHTRIQSDSPMQGSKIRSTYIAFAQKEKKRIEAEIVASAQEVATREKEVSRLQGQLISSVRRFCQQTLRIGMHAS